MGGSSRVLDENANVTETGLSNKPFLIFEYISMPVLRFNLLGLEVQ
jgi:hypothetical protein